MKRIWNKTTRRILILFIGLAFASVAVFVQNSIVSRQVTTEKVFVAKEDLLPYHTIEGKFVLRDVVKSEIPEDAIRDLNELEPGKWVVGEIGLHKDYPVQKSKLLLAEDSKFGPSLELKENKMFVGVETDQIRSAGDYIKPGVIVDAYVYIKETPETPAQLISPQRDPNLKGLLVRDRQNQNGYDPQKDENQSRIPVVAIIETDNSSVAAALIEYQEVGRIYLVPTGVDKSFDVKDVLN